ncbi:MAG: alanine racemase [Caldilineaceae bacterium]|nr:alanine racemase [Caldilineaceae bacterium]
MTEIGLRIEELDTPALWVDLGRLERNIQCVAEELAGLGVSWRPHVKGIKVPAIAHKLVRAGAIGVTCGKLGEAEVMAAAGIGDILVANQVVGPQKVARLAALQRHADVKSAVDSVENVTEIGQAASAIGVEVGLLIELDTGMHRAGVLPGEPVLALAKVIEQTPGVKLRGLMTWEGHHLGHTDEADKKAGIEESIGQLLSSAELCRNAGIAIEIVSGGGSGTYMYTAKIPGMTEVQAGGAIFCDQTYQGWGLALEPSLFLRARVTSRPAPDRLICDTGFKTHTRGFASPKPTSFDAKSVVLSAEHGIVTLGENKDGANDWLKVGTTFDLMPGYGDATVFLHDTLYGVREGVVETVWDVAARGKLR